MRRAKQLSLFNDKIPRHFGGALLKGNPKMARPISTKHAMHLVMKSDLAYGARSFLQNYNVKKIDGIIRRQAKKRGVRLYNLVNVGNHIHLVIKLDNLRLYKPFICSITGLIARHVLKAERSSPKKLKFWPARPFTRIISWGRDWDHIKKYMEKNQIQSRFRKAFVDWGFGVTNLGAITGLNTS